ncbi:NAD(P)/FAD-dependent oxidoreductase [Aeropyrum camini]|uniref:NAD(P)/FAD-dependent oxidoreductase n=1 Tax=Aeropyrum camini TaxID=229980 RepID=UPI001E65AE5A|nr:NAD(P)/FAD-dependent oxidoreductase [Aeropyrum camini]
MAVVGGGFAGLVFARELASLGLTIELYEEHGRVGMPEHCTGIVSGRTVDIIGREARETILDSYNSLEIRFRGRTIALLDVGGVYRLDRVRLEDLLLESLRSLGGRVLLRTRVESVGSDGAVRTNGGEARYDAVILADGVHGSLHRRLGIGYMGSHHYGLNILVPGGGESAIMVDFRLEGGVAFSWEVPSSRGFSVAGAMGTLEGVKRYYESLGTRALKVYGGRIPAGPPAEMLWEGRVFVVGDAGGLVKPLSGGGLYPNAKAAKLAASFIRRGLDVVDALAGSLSIVSDELRAQYAVARLVYGTRVLESISRAIGDTPLRLKLDYDTHHQLLLSTLAQAGPLPSLKLIAAALKGGGVEAPLSLLKILYHSTVSTYRRLAAFTLSKV